MTTAIVWFRRDLRLADNPALASALRGANTVIPLYIHPPDAGDWALGAAGRWWLHHSLAALDRSLRELGSRLVIRRGPELRILRDVIAETGATAVHWNRCYEPREIARDREIKQALREAGTAVESFNGSLLYEPWEAGRSGGEPYRVFTPFWKALQQQGLDMPPEPRPESLPPVSENVQSIELAELGLLPQIAWDRGFYETWQVGEAAALAQADRFIETGLREYKENRDRPDLPATSRLSPYLRFGEISPRQIVRAVRENRAPGADTGAEAFLRELGWREFAYHLLFHFPQTPEEPLDARFAALPWADDYGEALSAWQRGRTGIPLVDAGMRELWHTGWMHNRVRMVVASLLTKNLLIPWQEGARWFWDTLVDADLANNTLGWQWTAGCGADAAPYFRVFNPVLQGQKFDAEGAYVRNWVPELAGLPDAWLHQPWKAPVEVLAASGIRLGQTYPWPAVDLQSSRERALAAFDRIKKG